MAADAPARLRESFNVGWRFHLGDATGAEQPGFDDAGWEPVGLPHSFSIPYFQSPAFYVGEGWYRKALVIDEHGMRGQTFLEFEGVRQAAEVWVNGQSVALSENGSMAFGADITAALRPGENLVAVRVDNDWKYKERATGSGFQWNNNNFNVNYGGITKNVRLHMTGPVYQTLPLFSGLGTIGQYVWADEFDVKARTATIHAQTQIRNAGAAPRKIGYRAEIRRTTP